jgi:nucleoside-triphosphatase THEP1
MLVLAIVAGLVARNIDAEALLRAGERFGFQRLGLTLGLAVNTVPHLTDATRHVAMAWRVRRRSSTARPPSPLQLIEVLLAHVARIADEAAASASLRGHHALLRKPMAVSSAIPVVVASGPTGSGKTTAVARVVEQIQASGSRVVGILQPARFSGDRKVGISIRDLFTGEEVELARSVARTEGDHGTRFRFCDDGFALARTALARARAGDIVVVDELGPLELRGKGHMPAVKRALAAPGVAIAVLVVRSQLVPALLAALAVEDATILDVTTDHGPSDLLSTVRRNVINSIATRR